MSSFVFNIAKGKLAHYASLPGASDSLLVIPLQTSGLEADGILQDKTDLAALVGGTTREQTVMGRKTASSVTVTVDNAANVVDIDLGDVTWTAATGNPVSAIVIAYKPATSSVESAIIPLTKHSFGVTPNGGDISAIIPTAGLYRIS